MKVDIEDVAFWMDAVRNSKDKYRTLESFWKGQLRSKVWLVESLENTMKNSLIPNNIIIHGGWHGVLANLLFNSNLLISSITSVDIDPECAEIARTVNKRQDLEGRFFAKIEDMTRYNYSSTPTVVINTSCEHITDEQFNIWFNKIPATSLVVLQSNNYFGLEEHINCVQSVDEFKNKVNMNIMYSGEKQLQLYKRFMLIGRKD